MFAVNQEHLTDPFASAWYEWPVMIKPVLYWTQAGQKNTQAVLYFIGNPFLWLMGLLSVFAGLWALFHRWRRRGTREVLTSGLFLTMVGYAANLLPFMFISRILFNYHYSSSLIFFFIFTLGLQSIWTRFGPAAKWRLYVGVLALTIIAFLFIAPFTYGIPVSRAYLHW